MYPYWPLEVGRNESPARYVFLRTQSPLPPSSARTLLTYVPHRHHSSAPFVIIHPFFRFPATTTRSLLSFGFPAFALRTINCITNTIRPYSSIVPPPIVPAILAIERLSDFGHPYHTHEFPCIISTMAVQKAFLGVCFKKSMELGRYHT